MEASRAIPEKPLEGLDPEALRCARQDERRHLCRENEKTAKTERAGRPTRDGCYA